MEPHVKKPTKEFAEFVIKAVEDQRVKDLARKLKNPKVKRKTT